MFLLALLAHGFCVISEFADFEYKCTDYYHPEDEGSVLWNDSSLEIPWPVVNPHLSEKDASALPLSEIPKEKLPVYEDN